MTTSYTINAFTLKMIMTLIAFFISFNLNATDKTFKEHHIEGFGSIEIPENMELQAGSYKVIADSYRTRLIIGYSTDETVRYIFQPKGLNDFHKSAFNLYSRIIVSTDFDLQGSYHSLDTSYKATPYELYKLEQEVRNELNPLGIKLISFYGADSVKIGKQNAFKFSYLRQLNSNPPVLVNTYIFQNNDRLHRLTMSYRKSEEDLWKPLFDKSLRSISIEKR